MKQRLRYFCLLCILASFPLAFIWATWEGNAGTGAASDFPGPGLYARSDMFPRNTLVEIENLETGSTVRAVVTGSSGVPGLVAVLSPDTASALNIRQGAVVRVRIHIPAPVSERPAPGTLSTDDRLAVIDPDVNPETAVTDIDSAVSPDNAVIPLAAIAGQEEYPLVPVTEAVQEETFDDALASGEIASMDETEVPGEMMDSAAEAALTDDTAIAAEETLPEEETPVPDDTVTVQEDAPDPALADTSSVVYDEPQLVMPEETETDMTADTVESVTLEPAEPLPPEPESTDIPVVEAPPVFAAIAIPPDAPVLEDIPVVEEKIEQVPEAAPAVETAPVLKPAEVPASYSADIPFVGQLEKGAFYVQIAVYRDALNTRTVLDRFGKKYPIKVQKGISAGKSVMKVSVGPLKKDEFGAVLEYFQKNGFSDAFVRQE